MLDLVKNIDGNPFEHTRSFQFVMENNMPREHEIMWEEVDWFDDDDFDLDDDDDNDFDSDYGENAIVKFLATRKNTLIPTPFGPIPVDDVSSPLHNTRFFVGHINFHLSKKVVEAINNVEGVEFLKIMSKYRFIIGVGLMFMPANITRDIEKALGIAERDNLNQVDEDEKLEKEIAQADTSQDVESAMNCVLSLVQKDQKWIAYVYPNGEHVIKVASTDEQFANKLKEFEELELMSHGVIMRYND